MFYLTNQKCKVKNVNTRPEIHGEEIKLGSDIHITMESENDILTMFNPDLIPMYFRPKAVEDLDLVDNAMDETGFTELRAKDIDNVFTLEWMGEGYRVEIPYGISETQDLYLINATVDKIKVKCKHGGMVQLEFRVKVSGISIADSGNVNGLMLRESISLTLEPPAVEDRAQMDIEHIRNALSA